MTNAQRLHRIGCEKCNYTETIQINLEDDMTVLDTCECAFKEKEEGLDEDNYMELYGIKSV